MFFDVLTGNVGNVFLILIPLRLEDQGSLVAVAGTEPLAPDVNAELQRHVEPW
jgi:hypothetical protein